MKSTFAIEVAANATNLGDPRATQGTLKSRIAAVAAKAGNVVTAYLSDDGAEAAPAVNSSPTVDLGATYGGLHYAGPETERFINARAIAEGLTAVATGLSEMTLGRAQAAETLSGLIKILPPMWAATGSRDMMGWALGDKLVSIAKALEESGPVADKVSQLVALAKHQSTNLPMLVPSFHRVPGAIERQAAALAHTTKTKGHRDANGHLTSPASDSVRTPGRYKSDI